MKLSLDLRTTLTQTLTPQQIQYLKLLQLPVIQFEQQVLQEIEQNPMLDEVEDFELAPINSDDYNIAESPAMEVASTSDEAAAAEALPPTDKKTELLPEDSDPFEFHKLLWQDDSTYYKKTQQSAYDDDDNEPFQIKDNTSFLDDLVQQLHMLDLSEEEIFLGEQIIGNIDGDGYLRRELEEILQESNDLLTELKLEVEVKAANAGREKETGQNPARQFALSEESKSILNKVYDTNPEIVDSLVKMYQDKKFKFDKGNHKEFTFNILNQEQAEKVLYNIQHLDPPGVGSRTVQECLVAQCKVVVKPNAAQKLALEILTQTYDAFTKKHYHVITKQLGVTEDYLKEAIEVIRRLNPKPGGSDAHVEINTVIPDFIIEKDEDTNELIINMNDSHMPALKLNKAYEKMKKEAHYKLSNKETKEWLRNKYEDAKFLIQAIRQRKSTMLKVMTAIAYLQKNFFYEGPASIRPLIYKDVAENTGLDISTVCRIVNGKYVQTVYGTFELKYFFSESLPNDDGEEVSTRVIKQVIRDIIDEESKTKPLSDDKIGKLLKDKGYNVARRTVAKYREQLKIPVARLRKEI